jgi:hypothetical protein
MAIALESTDRRGGGDAVCAVELPDRIAEPVQVPLDFEYVGSDGERARDVQGSRCGGGHDDET